VPKSASSGLNTAPNQTGGARGHGFGAGFCGRDSGGRGLRGDSKAGQRGEHADCKRFSRVRARERAFHERHHFRVQQLPAAREALFDGVLGEIERLGDLLDGLVLAIKEHEDLAVGLGNAFN
jgi:hypothetical protein